MIVIFDFDRTLFDNKKFFEEDMPDLIGIDRKKFLMADDSEIHKNQKKIFDPNRYLQKLGKDDRYTKEKINGLFKRVDKYLMPGALELLEIFKRNKKEMYLVTAGNKSWQKRKVDNIKSLSVYFDSKHKIFTTDKAKAVKFLKNIDGKIVIINDKPEESFAIKKAIGRKCQIYIVKSKYSENSGYKGEIYDNLLSLKEVIKRCFI